jgi:hypothetical protein
VAAVALLSVGVAIGIAVSGHVAAVPAAVTGKPRVVYSDDFKDPSSGWRTDTLPQGATFRYTSEGYVVTGTGDYAWFAAAPYREPIQQVSMSATATAVTNDEASAGFGVSCVRGEGTSTIRYELTVRGAGQWRIERRDGPTGTSTVSLLAEGRSPASPGATPMTVTGSCLTQADGQTTTLEVWVNGSKVGSTVDYADSLAGSGWYGGLQVSSHGSIPCSATVTRFVERTGPPTG